LWPSTGDATGSNVQIGTNYQTSEREGRILPSRFGVGLFPFQN